MSNYQVRLRTPTSGYEDTEVNTATDQGGYSLRTHVRELGVVTSEAGDLFEALARLRRKLEPLGYRLLLNGARRNAWASGMARDMGGGRRAYLLTMGRPSRMEDLVDIFEPAPEAEVGTVEEQETFMRLWVESISPIGR